MFIFCRTHKKTACLIKAWKFHNCVLTEQQAISTSTPSTAKQTVTFNESSDLPTDSVKRSTWFGCHTVVVWLTAKCGSKSTRSFSVNPEISSARGRWSTTACGGAPLPRPLEPRPLALRAPRPRAWTPLPRPGARIPLLAACVPKTGREASRSERKYLAEILTHIWFDVTVTRFSAAFWFDVWETVKALPQSAAECTSSSTLLCPLRPESFCTGPALRPAAPFVPGHRISSHQERWHWGQIIQRPLFRVSFVTSIRTRAAV